MEEETETEAVGNEAETIPMRSKRAEFQQTRWSMVVRAQETQEADAQEAMAYLCSSYWYPLYFFARRKYGKSHHEAEDLTQGFLGDLIAKGHVKAADEERGKFRTFLLTYFDNFLQNERRKMAAEKRGGGRTPISIDHQLAEKKFDAEPVDDATPEELFDRRWALNVFELALKDIGGEYASKGKTNVFAAIKSNLAWNSGETSYAEVAKKCGMKEGAVRIEIHRMRQRFRKLLEERIAQTVVSSEEVEAELRYLCSLLV